MSVQMSLFDVEEWRDVPRYEGLYAISDQGRLFNCKTQRYIGSKPPPVNRHIIAALRKDGELVGSFGVHQLVMLAFVGDCPVGMEVNHINAIKYDNRLENLEYITHAQNIQHAVSMGLMGKNSKATKPLVKELYELGWLPIKIAEYIGVTHQRVSQILREMGINHRAEKPRKIHIKKGTHHAPRKAYINHMMQMYRNGMTTTEIAREMNTTPQAVSTALSYWLPKEERRNKRRTAEEAALNRQRIHELASQGHTIKTISEITNTKYAFVHKVLREAANQ